MNAMTADELRNVKCPECGDSAAEHLIFADMVTAADCSLTMFDVLAAAWPAPVVDREKFAALLHDDGADEHGAFCRHTIEPPQCVAWADYLIAAMSWRTEAEIKAEHRQEWADYFENWSVSIGPEPPTVQTMIDALRRENPPFGMARADRIGGEQA